MYWTANLSVKQGKSVDITIPLNFDDLPIKSYLLGKPLYSIVYPQQEFRLA